MISFEEMTRRIQQLKPEERKALKEFYDLDSDHDLVKFAEQLLNALRKAIRKVETR